MKISFLAFIWLLSSPYLTFCQQVFFNDEPVDTFHIFSTSGYYHFDKAGTTTGYKDDLIIVYDSIQKKYVIGGFSTTLLKWVSTSDSVDEKKKVYKKNIGDIIGAEVLAELINAFSVKYNKPKFENLGLNESYFYQYVIDHRIKKVAKQYHEAWQFKRKYSTKEENKIIYKGCQNIDTINLFLKEVVDTASYVITTDYWSGTGLYFITKNKSYYFKNQGASALSQPWYETRPEPAINYSPILNLEIGKCLTKILPQKYLERNHAKLENWLDHYIKWYLERRGIIYTYSHKTKDESISK